MAWQRRLLKDIEELKNAGFKVMPESGDELSIDCFRVVLNGPKDTPYENGSWNIRFTVANTYPFKSPSVGFVEHILHPNVDWASGSICLDALNSKWSPVFTLKHIMETLIPYLMAYPNPDDPLNREAAQLFNENHVQYNARVVENVKRFAHSKPVGIDS
jgi:ubiquitin-conjugating enzyme E2 H